MAISQLIFGIASTDGSLHSSQLHYSWVYILAPLVGGAIAGLIQRAHENVMKKMKTGDHAEAEGRLRRSIQDGAEEPMT